MVLQSTMRGENGQFWNFESFNPPRSAINWENKDLLVECPDRVAVKASYLDIPRKWRHRPPTGHDRKRAVQHIFGNTQKGQLAQNFPFLVCGAYVRYDRACDAGCIGHGVREILEFYGYQDCTAVCVLAQQQVQKGSFASAVSAGEPQLPIGVYVEADVFKNIVIAALMGEGQILNVDQCHCFALPENSMSRKKVNSRGSTIHQGEPFGRKKRASKTI